MANIVPREYARARSESKLVKVDLPSDDQLAASMRTWAASLGEDTPQAATVLRRAVGTVSAQVVLAPGKKRGYTQLRFRVHAWSALRAVTGDRLPESPPEAPDSSGEDQDLSPEFVLDLGAPTAMDRWAPQIVAWRAGGMIWGEIVRRTGLDLNRAYLAWKRHTEAKPDQPS